MEHYKRTQLVAKDLQTFLTDPDRENWSTFCRKMTIKHGVRRRFLERLLQENYPQFTVEGETIVEATE